MTTGILEALTQLFALFASGRTEKEELAGRQAANRYLSVRLSKSVVDRYLDSYDTHLETFRLKKNSGEVTEAKRLSKLSTKLLRTCSSINKELPQRDKSVVYLRLVEFVNLTDVHSNSKEFLEAVASSFLLQKVDVLGIQALVNANSPTIESTEGGFIYDELGGYRLSNNSLFLVKHFGNEAVYLNNQPITNGSISIMVPGSVIKIENKSRIFFSDLIRQFLDSPEVPKIDFEAKGIGHYFKYPKERALHELNLKEREGTLVGIMGGSGSGKSTLLNILNGTINPLFGQVLLNGVDIHEEATKVNGIIGHIAQEDALISELSVRKNLLYSAKLTFGELSNSEINIKVNETLKSLGLWEVKDLRVGSILDKTISGGQRKRLNIALELIREPLVLFVDEPTSGLSSYDSIQIMDLLKELSYRGKLVFAVIHQPSSEIFKLFDKFLLLDQGGYPIYYGVPTSIIPYFKRITNQVDPNQSSCLQCGNINPEQIFETIETREIDEYGNISNNRKISPEEWNGFYIEETKRTEKEDDKDLNFQKLDPLNSSPTGVSQFLSFFSRDLFSKLTNKQYLLINLLEAPMLAALLSLFMRYTPEGGIYIYKTSENIPQFLFISVIISFFLGLSISAEEIHRDKAILRRERFLFLKWGRYLQAKIAVSFIASFVQTLGFVAISHLILEIPGMFWIHVIVLFSVSMFGNLVGLNISAAFKSAKVIYMIIPLLVIPQIIFGGAIVRFDRFNHWFTHETHVPFLGDLMVSRWAFEALAVYAYRENQYEKHFVEFDDVIKHTAWRRDFWLDEICNSSRNKSWTKREWERAGIELRAWSIAVPQDGQENESEWKAAFNSAYHKAFKAKDQVKARLIEKGALRVLKEDNYNNEIAEWVLQEDRSVRILDLEQGLSPTSSPIHHHTRDVAGWNAPYYSASKRVLGNDMKTPFYNVLVLWLMTAIAWGILRFARPLRRRG